MTIWGGLQELVAWFLALNAAMQALTLAALPIAATVLAWLSKKAVVGLKWLTQGLRKLRLRIQTRRAMPQIVEAYKKQVERQTLGIRHAWMPRDTTIENLLVPAQGQTDEDAIVDVFEHFLSQFREKRRSIHVFTGSPGGGKSVALALAVRAAWESLEGFETGGIERMPSFIPILLQFADAASFARLEGAQYKDSFDLQKRFEAILLASLERTMFAHGHPRAQAIREQFLSEQIADRRLLLVVDGLDVLPRTDRDSALRDLLSFVGTSHVCLIGCRDEVFPEHRRVFQDYGARRFRVLGFTQSTSERFLRRWAILTGQDTEHPLDFLSDRAAQRRIVANPLLLTIACFLKARDVADDLRRVTDFYQECAKALLTNWDQETGAPRNKQQRQSYEQHLLGRLGQHQAVSEDITSGLDRAEVHRLFREWIKQDLDSTAPMGTEVKILDELVVHSGLLVVLESGRVDFLHRTFMEYFAARRYAQERSSVGDLQRHWKSDPVRYERLATFYCSVADDGPAASFFIEQALDRQDVRFAVALAAQSPNISGPSYLRLLAAVGVAMKLPSEDLIETLGDLSRCSNAMAAREALSQLQHIVERHGDHPLAIVEATLREIAGDTARGVATLMACADNVRLPRVIAGLSAQTIARIGREITLDETQPARIVQWIASLRQVERYQELLDTFATLREPALRAEAAMAVASLSGVDGFWHAFDSRRVATHAGDQQAQALFVRWGWPHPLPSTQHGKRTALEVAQCLADALSRDEFPFRPLAVAAHRWLYFAVHGLAWERHYAEKPGDCAAKADEWRAPIVTTMFRSMPKLVRIVWVNHPSFKVRPRSRIARVLHWSAMFAPLALLVVVLIDVGSSMRASLPIPRQALAAAACLVGGDLLGWAWIASQPWRHYGLRTPLDFAVATILGPAFVLRELPREVISKRRDDRFVICWTAAMVVLTCAALLFSEGPTYAALAFITGCDALIQANNRLGALPWASIQCDAMTNYLSSGSSPDAG